MALNRGTESSLPGLSQLDVPSIGAALLAELALRPAAEFGLLLLDRVYWGIGVTPGDKHAVLVLPGLGAGDDYLLPLRGWLGRVGYTPICSGLHRNPGWSEELVYQLGEVAEDAFLRSRQCVSIAGHSMGGVLGRSVALRSPHLVRHVIALGSPLASSRRTLAQTVRMTAIYSRSDRIVPHPYALAPDARADNVEVGGSHIGLATNPQVYRHLARLLSASGS